MIDSTQQVVHSFPAERVVGGAAIVSPAVKGSHTAGKAVGHFSPFVLVQVTHALPHTHSELSPFGGDFLYDVQLGENLDAGPTFCMCRGVREKLESSYHTSENSSRRREGGRGEGGREGGRERKGRGKEGEEEEGKWEERGYILKVLVIMTIIIILRVCFDLVSFHTTWLVVTVNSPKSV